jgi:putative ABC transport system substrate-binding protein
LKITYRIPVISPFQEITEAGGVMGYGPDLSTLFRCSAAVVDRILKGTKPGDIPIGEPQKFDLSINLASSRELGLTIPNSLLSRVTFLVQEAENSTVEIGGVNVRFWHKADIMTMLSNVRFRE